MTKWQPIATAPKDGTEFLAYDKSNGKMDVATMQNIMRESHPPIWLCWPTQSDGETGPYPEDFGHEQKSITHWMPLPKAPK